MIEVLGNWIWQGSLVGAGTGLVLAALRRAGGGVREIVCWFSLALVLVLPWLALLPYLQLEPIPVAVSATLASMPSHTPGGVSITSLVLLLWFGWCGRRLALVARGVTGIRAARRRSHGVSPALEHRLSHWSHVCATGRRARLVVSEDTPCAAVLGGRRPLIAVAPALVEHVEDADLDRVVVHEWVHVQRRDDVAIVLQALIVAVAGWHPAVWWLDRRIRLEREAACDDAVVSITGDERAYAACLTNLAALALVGEGVAVPSVFGGSSLRRRVTGILSMHLRLPHRQQQIGGYLAAGALAVLVAAVALAPVRLVARVVAAPSPGPLRDAAALTTTVASRGEGPARPLADRPRTVAPRTTSRGKVTVTTAVDAAARSASMTAVALDDTSPPAPDGPPLLLSRGAPALTAAPTLIASDVGMSAGHPSLEPNLWRAAARGSAAIGHASQKAATATAGFFSRVAKRTSGTF